MGLENWPILNGLNGDQQLTLIEVADFHDL